MRFSRDHFSRACARVLSAARSLGIAVFLAILLLLVAEGALRAVGYGRPVTRFVRAAQSGLNVWRDNPLFAARFFPGAWLPDSAPTQVPAAKERATLRIAVLGESAAYGYPDPAFSFGRVLQAMLEQDCPDRKVEVINAAQSGVSSPVLREVMHDVLALQPYAVVLYMGNNEFIGPYGAGNPKSTSSASPTFARMQVLASRLRLSQGLRRLAGESTLPGTPTMMACRPIAPDDPVVANTHAWFEDNLQAMLSEAEAAGVPIVLCTVPVNVRDWSPFHSLHRPDLSEAEQSAWKAAWDEGAAQWTAGEPAAALAAWQQAEALDPLPAELQFALGKAWDALGESAKADEACQRALVQDAMPFRTTPDMSLRVRALAEQHAAGNVVLADCAQDFAESTAPQGPDRRFLDHCHLSMEGNYQVALGIRTALIEIGLEIHPNELAPAEVVHRLGWGPWHERDNLKYVRNRANSAPFPSRWEHEAWLARLDAEISALDAALDESGLLALRKSLEEACAAHPADPWLARNAAQVETACGDGTAAAARLTALTQQQPAFTLAWPLLARAQLQLKDFTAAVAAWQAAVALRPDRRDWRLALADALFEKADYPAARDVYLELAQSQPASADTWWKVGQTHEREDRFDAAIATYRQGLAHSPEHAGLHYYLAKALVHQGQPDEARAVAETGYRLDPTNAGLEKLVGDLKAKP